MKSIVTLTMNPTVDIAAVAENVVHTFKVRCTSVRHDPGGGGINVARVVHKLGSEVIAAFPAGGPPGNRLQQLLDREGLCQRLVAIKDDTRDSFTVFERATGNEYRFVLPGPELHESEWRSCLDLLKCLPMNYLVLSGSLPRGVPENFYAQAARTAKKQGARVLVDTAGTALKAALDEGVYLVKPNLRELMDLTECTANEKAEQAQLARSLIKTGKAEIVALTLGHKGALLAWDDDTLHLRAPLVTTQSAVGAGDSFLGGFLVGLVRGWALTDSFRLAMAAGAAALLTPGTELCRPEDVVRLYIETNWKELASDPAG